MKYERLLCLVTNSSDMLICDIWIFPVQTKKFRFLLKRTRQKRFADIREGKWKQPIAAKLPLAWSLFKPTAGNSWNSLQVDLVQTHTLQQQLEDMWKADVKDTNRQDGPKMSRKNRYTFDLMEGCVKFNDGHYELQLQWRPYAPCLPQHRELALRRWTSLKRDFQRNYAIREGYVNPVQSYIEKGYCRQNPTDEASANTTWYLPHHAAINPREPSKVRVVFYRPGKWQGLSHSDALIHGPDLANSLVGVLTRFRMHPVTVVADVQEMLHQVRRQQRDCDALRFVWWPNGDIMKEPVHYQMVVHLFGTTLSRSITNVCLKVVTKGYCREFDPDAASIGLNDFYVEDRLVSFRDDETAKKFVPQIISVLVKCGFKLTAWLRNSQNVLPTTLEAEKWRPIELELNSGTELCERALGVHWNEDRDAFGFSVEENGNVTKDCTINIWYVVFMYWGEGPQGHRIKPLITQ